MYADPLILHVLTCSFPARRASDLPRGAGCENVGDSMGGMFGAIGIMAALIERGITGQGQEVQSALFENNIFLVGQHMLQYAITGVAAAPMQIGSTRLNSSH